MIEFAIYDHDDALALTNTRPMGLFANDDEDAIKRINQLIANHHEGCGILLPSEGPTVRTMRAVALVKLYEITHREVSLKK